MTQTAVRILAPLLAGLLLDSCVTHVPAAAVAWNDAAPLMAPLTAASPIASGDVGYLRVETDTDLREIGRQMYYNVRRPFDIYSPEGKLLRADVDNQGGRSGEEPVLVPLEPGRYVIASVYGTVYRKLQAVVRAGARTEIPEKALREAPPVFPK